MNAPSASEKLKALLAAKTGKKPAQESGSNQLTAGTTAAPSAQPETSASLAPSVQETSASTETGEPKESGESRESVVSLDCPPEYHVFKEKLMQLEDALETERPGFQYILRDVWQACRKDASIVTILSDEEIGLVVSGLAKMKGIVLGTEAKATGTRRTKTKVMTTDMI